MTRNKTRPVEGFNDRWWVRPSVIRRRDIEEIMRIVNGAHIRAGVSPDQLSIVTLDELANLPPERLACVQINGDALVDLGSSRGFARGERAGSIVYDGTYGPEKHAVPVDNYLRRHCRRLARPDRLRYWFWPAVSVLVAALCGGIVAIVGANRLWYLAVIIGPIPSLVAAVRGEQLRRISQEKDQPPHRLSL